MAGYDAGVLQPGTLPYLMGIMRCWHSDLHELENTYRHLAGVPLLLLWGDRDQAVPVTSAAGVRQAAPHAELVVLPGVGHLPQEEAPEEFHRVVLDFFGRSRPGK
jgi:pimeloyl-ACP methyl ester carboxylesterase